MCLFCEIVKKRITSNIIFENKIFLVILDVFPIEEGHALVIPKKHFDNALSCEKNILEKSLGLAKTIALKIKMNLKADGFNITTNIEKIAGQEIGHYHLHIIPRYKSDPKNFEAKRLKTTFKELKKISNLINS